MPVKYSSAALRSGVLPASGAYDATPVFASTLPATILDVRNASKLRLSFAYTRGTTGGAFKVKILTSVDGAGFDEDTVIDGSSLSNGAANVFSAELKFPVAAGPAAERRSLKLDVSDCAYVAVVCAEYGATGTPGALVANAGLGS